MDVRGETGIDRTFSARQNRGRNPLEIKPSAVAWLFKYQFIKYLPNDGYANISVLTTSYCGV